jgi:tetratricopeptide (TPR) repeat protein
VKKKIILIVGLTTFLFWGCSRAPKLAVDDYLHRAVKSADNGDWKRAFEDAEKAIELEPKNPNAILMYSLTLEQDMKISTALDYMEKIGDTVTDDFMVQFTYGRMLYRKGEQGGGSVSFTRALEPLNNALKLKPNNLETLILLAMCREKLGMFDDAKMIFDKIRKTKEFVNQPQPYNEVAICLVHLYKSKPSPQVLSYAKKYFVAAYNRGKKNPMVVYNIAKFYDQYLGNKTTSKSLYKRFIILARDNPQLFEKIQEVKETLKNL